MTKKSAKATGNQVDQVDNETELTPEEKARREQFIRSVHRRVENKTWREIAEAIVWTCEQIYSGNPQPDPDPLYEAPRGTGEVSVNMDEVENRIRKILIEQGFVQDTSPE